MSLVPSHNNDLSIPEGVVDSGVLRGVVRNDSCSASINGLIVLMRVQQTLHNLGSSITRVSKVCF